MTEDSAGLRVPAAEIEQLVSSRVHRRLLDPGSIYTSTSARLSDSSMQQRLVARAADIGKRWPELPVARKRAVLVAPIERNEVSVDQIDIRLRPPRLSALLDVAQTGNGNTLGEATLEVSGTFAGEAIRPLILFIAPHTATAEAVGGSGSRAGRKARSSPPSAIADVCHTVPGGPAYSGGRPIPTPFGTVYSTNIASDAQTGIGSWSEEAFRRTMREGIARDGSYLYPAFPYDHYAKLRDGDTHALYAFVMTRSPVESRPPPNELPFPLSIRRIVDLWDLLYLDTTPFRSDPNQPAQWNHGAYLVQGLGHCGDCHRTRNFLGAEASDKALAGGEAEDWYAPALNAASRCRCLGTRSICSHTCIKAGTSSTARRPVGCSR